MRLYSAKVGPISAEIVRVLTSAGDIDAEVPHEVEVDIQSVLNGYLATEREVNDRAKELLDRMNRPQSDLGRMRQQVAEQKGVKIGDEMLDYLLDQIVEILHHSSHVDEIYPEDVVLRRKMAPILKKHGAIEDAIEAEVRAQLKHVKEGTRTWDIEHARILEQIRRNRGLA
jgi:hypothetical protein